MVSWNFYKLLMEKDCVMAAAELQRSSRVWVIAMSLRTVVWLVITGVTVQSLRRR